MLILGIPKLLSDSLRIQFPFLEEPKTYAQLTSKTDYPSPSNFIKAILNNYLGTSFRPEFDFPVKMLMVKRYITYDIIYD